MMGVQLTAEDYKIISYWYDSCFEIDKKPRQKDLNTIVKIKAFAISELEERARFSRMLDGKDRD